MTRSHSLKDLSHVVTEIITRGFYMARSHSLKDLSHVVTEIITRCLYGNISQPQRFVSCSD